MRQESYKRKYTYKELYIALKKALRTSKNFRKSIKNKEINKEFMERIMLAVTEVNGCAICSYAHTKIALEQGMGKEEINKLLAGDVGDIPEDQAVAIFFAQHYADKRGKPSKKAWLRLVNEYGKEKALGILGTIRMIMVGNIIFIPVGALISRFKGQAMEESSLPYELGMFLSILVFLPMILVEKIIAKIARLFWKR